MHCRHSWPALWHQQPSPAPPVVAQHWKRVEADEHGHCLECEWCRLWACRVLDNLCKALCLRELTEASLSGARSTCIRTCLWLLVSTHLDALHACALCSQLHDFATRLASPADAVAAGAHVRRPDDAAAWASSKAAIRNMCPRPCSFHTVRCAASTTAALLGAVQSRCEDADASLTCKSRPRVDALS